MNDMSYGQEQYRVRTARTGIKVGFLPLAMDAAPGAE
jgi:hypothetical protein